MAKECKNLATNLIRQVSKYDDIVIVGIWHNALHAYCFLKHTGKPIHFCADVLEHQFKGNRIYGVLEASRVFPNALFCLALDNNGNEAHRNKLISLGVNKENFLTSDEVASIVKDTDKFFPREYIYHLDIAVAEHCNLNCVCCNVFAPLVKEEVFIDYNTLENDLTRLRELCPNDGDIGILQFLGGEPLLNPSVNKILAMARKIFPLTRFILITNGLLLPKMQDDFFDTCRENNVEIHITRYPVKFDYNAAVEMCRSKNVKAFIFFDGSRDEMVHHRYDLDGNQDMNTSFSNCMISNDCLKLHKGRIYTCAPSCHIDRFNDYFNVNLPISDNDSIDIYKAKSKEEILEFLSNPIQLCKHCITSGLEMQKWHVAKKEISEFL